MLTSHSLIVDALISAECDKWRMDSWCCQETAPCRESHQLKVFYPSQSLRKIVKCRAWYKEVTTSVRVALWIRIMMTGQLAELSWLTFCTFQLISMEPHSLATRKEHSRSFFAVSFSIYPDNVTHYNLRSDHVAVDKRTHVYVNVNYYLHQLLNN